MIPQLVLSDAERRRFQVICERLVSDSNAGAVFLFGRHGQPLATAGRADHLDATSLASLVVGNIAVAGGLAQLIGEKRFSSLSIEGERDHLHLSLVGERAILAVLFDIGSTPELVRLRALQAGEELNPILEGLEQKVPAPGADGPFAELTDADIDNLFRG